MAEDRVFTLIGRFDDGITKHLENINDSIDSLKRNLGSFGARRGGFNDLTKSMGRVVGAHIKLNEQVVSLRNEMRNSLPVLREYRREVGKAISANMHMAGGKRIAKKNNPYLQFLDQATRQTRELATASRGVQLGRRMPRGGGGGGGNGGPRPPRLPYQESGGGGGGKNRWGVSRDATFAFGQTLGYGLSTSITGAITQGFQIGVGLLMKPFQYLQQGMAERIADESSDIQAAGAMFAIAQRKNMNMFSNFNDAIRAQQDINKKLAESAAALPGSTQEYVQMGKRVLDSMMTVLSKDVKGVSAFAAEMGADPASQKDVLGTLTQKFTEKAVLLGMGSSYRGAYGVPQLLEQLIGSENVSENMFNRFAQFRDLPIFQSVFRDMEGEIAKTGAFSAERIRLIFKLLEEALPNEVIQAHKNTMAGFLEATRSAFLDPEVGLFGMGRKIQGIQMAMVDQYGNFLNKQGKIVATWEEAEKEQISLYESIQKILTGFGLPLSELASLLPKLFEPFAAFVKPLESLFRVSQSFYRNFNIYTKEFETLAKNLASQGLNEAAAKMKRTAGARGSLLAVANLLNSFGDMTGGDFAKISQQLQDPDANIGAIAKSVMTTLFSSNFMEDLGFQIGLLIGGVVNTVAQMLGFAQDTLGESRIIKGLKAGFDSVDGMKAIQYVITNIFKILFDAVTTVFKMAPAEFTAIGAISLLLPAFVSSFSVILANKLQDLLDAAELATNRRLAKMRGIEDFRNIYKFDKAKPKITGDVTPLSRRGVVASHARVLEKARMVNPQFPNIAIGDYPAMSLGGPKKAPSVPKPYSAYGRKGLRGIAEIIAGEADVKNLGKYMREAGGELAEGFKKQLGKGRKFAGVLGDFLKPGGKAGLLNPVGMMGKFGTALLGVTSILSGITRFFQTGDIWKSLGAVAGPIAGTIIGGAIAGPIGMILGGMIGEQEWITDTLGEAIRYISASLKDVGDVFMLFVKDLARIANSFTGASDEIDKFHGLLVALKVILTPLVAGFMALAQGARILFMMFKQAQIEFYSQGFFGLGKNPKMAAQLQKELASLHKDAANQMARDMGWFFTPKEGDKAVLKGQQVTMKNGQWVNSEGKTVSSGSTPAVTPSPIYTPKAPGASPVSVPAPTQTNQQTEQLLTDAKQTATNVAQLNTKAATQITHAVTTQKAAEETKKNTTAANVTLGNIKAGLMSISSKLSGIQTAVLGDLNNIQAGVASVSSLLSSGNLKVVAKGMGPMGGPMGNATGNLGAAQSLASQYGLTMTSWFRPGDPGYHGKGRAMDFSNGVSTPQQLAFAQALASQYGTSIKQLIYTPLGYGISNGTVVPLSYWGAGTNAMHYNHVHVAFAEGFNKGRMFTSQSAAAGWENSMVPGSVKVASITGNSAEGFGGNNYGDIIVTVNAGSVSDPDELASIVALKISEAVADARSASLFV